MSGRFRLFLDDGEGHRETKILHIDSTETVKSLKTAIQDKFSIPACCQKLYFESLKLRDSDRLTEHRFRDSDIILVKYETTADIHEITNALNCLKALLHMLMEEEQTPNAAKFNFCLVTLVPEKVVTLNRLGEKYFTKISTNKYYSNMALFMSNDGIDMLTKAHQLLVKHEAVPLLIVEAVFVLLWARLSLMRNCIDTHQLKDIAALLLKSFQRHDIQQSSTASHPDGMRLKKDVILLALRAISNLTASYSGIRESIASSEAALCQLNNVLSATELCNSPTAVVGVLGTFENLSESESTHVHLSAPWTIKALIDVCNRNNIDVMSAEHVRMGVTRTLSTVVVSSAHVMTLPDLLRTNIFLREALAQVDINAAHKFLHERLSGWIGTMKGLANMAYYPYKNPSHSCIQSYYSKKHKIAIQELELRCVEVGVVSLHIALLGEVEKQVLIKEGLVDYIVCLPWCLPRETRAHHRASDMISYLRGEIQLQPPSLLNLAKAKLASMHFGLKKMLSAFSMQDLFNTK